MADGLTIDKLREKLKSLTKPVNDKLKEVKEGADDFLNENVNVPLAERGYPKLGAGLAAAGSSAVDYVVPDSVEEGAMTLAAGPIGKIAGRASKIGRLGMAAEKAMPSAVKVAEKEAAPLVKGIAEKLEYADTKKLKPMLDKLKDEAAAWGAQRTREGDLKAKEIYAKIQKMLEPQASYGKE